ncbi:plasmid partitioning protein RepA [Mesorhizobium sp. P16.1]|uniref:plasmid partitioning protein RepA n=1 Tax=unclassified Mesorhizobium TaxID=325217 RepID=UPI0021A705DD|nr:MULTISPECIES: plasmid partitioning protein RepA [unclassified Mesorhizobium]MCT2580908.1 plasmid partitioning protein RepA [Mesorhizobium sp. P13.3]MDF3169953.1 plasmid partitioning protein RepA [Mesorhizobium sp. P16.1]MDF3181421.1 plasmid partitioning protein RepA [Mesorhizobium sp. P17.1]MDF3186912.1 plasmid partitioning protein RepA [Mesorhizobium sp. ICCV3110.1]
MQNQNVSTAISSDARISHHARQLSMQLQLLRERLFPPSSQKMLKTFTSGEAAQLIGVSDGYLRQLSLDGKGPSPEVSQTGRRSYSLAQIRELRQYMASIKPKDALTYLPWRQRGEKLQTIAVANFKGGSAKTTTSIYLAQYLALQGYRVLAVDLDPQASLSSMLGVQPEFDLAEGDTLNGAICYDEKRRPLKDIIRKTYFAGLDLVPGNLELMEFEHETPKALMERKTSNSEIFFRRVGVALAEVEAEYDIVVIDCPPQLGYLTLGAVCAATSLLITVHPQMVDVASMSQFLLMTSDLLSVVRNAGGDLNHDFIRYVVTRHEPHDGPQAQIVALLRSLFGDEVLAATVLKSTAIADAGLTKQTLYEIERGQVRRSTFDRAIESLDAVNGEILDGIKKAWGRS